MALSGKPHPQASSDREVCCNPLDHPDDFGYSGSLSRNCLEYHQPPTTVTEFPLPEDRTWPTPTVRRAMFRNRRGKPIYSTLGRMANVAPSAQQLVTPQDLWPDDYNVLAHIRYRDVAGPNMLNLDLSRGTHISQISPNLGKHGLWCRFKTAIRPFICLA